MPSIKKIEAKAEKVMVSTVPPKAEPLKPIEIYYVGKFSEAYRTGVSEKYYKFLRDKNSQPIALKVNAEDAPALLKEKGDGCFSHAPQRIFVTKAEYEEELNTARMANKQ